MTEEREPWAKRGANVEPQPVDPIDVEAAEIDARSPEAPEMIEELEEHAAELGRQVETPGDPYLEPPNSTVDDWFGQSVERDSALADELIEETGDPGTAERRFDQRATGEDEQARRHGPSIDPHDPADR